MTREHGSAAIELVAGTGLLMLPIVVLVLSLPSWSQTHTMARAAAREAARTVVLAADPTSEEATRAAWTAARTVAANHGRDVDEPPTFGWSSSVVPAADGEVRQAWLTATVTVRMPAIAIPMIGEWASFDWSVAHTEPLDVYRSREMEP